MTEVLDALRAVRVKLQGEGWTRGEYARDAVERQTT